MGIAEYGLLLLAGWAAVSYLPVLPLLLAARRAEGLEEGAGKRLRSLLRRSLAEKSFGARSVGSAREADGGGVKEQASGQTGGASPPGAGAPRARRQLPYLAKLAVVCLAYFASAKGGLALAFAYGSVTAVWAPTGLALAAVLVWGFRIWPAVALGAFLANLTTAAPLVSVLGITAGNTLEAVIGGYLIGRVSGFRPSLERVKDVLALVAFGAVISTLVSATVGVTSLWAGGALAASDLGVVWRVWWLGDMGGDLLVAPALLVLSARRLAFPGLVAAARAASLVLCLAAISVLVLSSGEPIAYLLFPALFWVALRFRQPGAVASSLVVSSVAVWFTADGQGPFVTGSPDGDLVRAQLFVGVAAATALLVAAVRTERQRAEEQLLSSEAANRVLAVERERLTDAMDRLRKSEAKLSEAQRVARIGSWEWDIAANEVNWSDELCRIHGVDGEQLPAGYERFLEGVHPEDRGRAGEGVERALAAQEPFSFHHRIVRPDGELRVLYVRGEVLVDDRGEPVRIAGTAQDVTEHKRKEEALSLQSEITATMAEGVVLIRAADQIIVYANATFERMFGYDRDELVGKPAEMVCGRKCPEETTAEIMDALDAGGSWTGEVDSLKKDGTRFWCQANVSSFDHSEHGTVWVAVHSDITERKRFEAELRHLADHDALTDLYNRRRFVEELAREVARVKRYGGTASLMLLDLDQFKDVNDSLGHMAGDSVIRAVAAALRRRLRTTDVLARLGGDEFAVLLPAADETRAREAAHALLEVVRGQGIVVRKRQLRLTASIGVAFLTSERAASEDELLVEADLALYEAKDAGRDRMAIHRPEAGSQNPAQRRLASLERIRCALDGDGFVLHYQPIVELATGQVAQYEALIRMDAGSGELVLPGDFVSIAERFGMIEAIDRWVIGHAIAALADPRTPVDARLAVNLSAHSLADRKLPGFIERQLAERAVDPHRLVLEITETAAISSIQEAKDFARQLMQLGCSFALDDFGSGFGSFYYLKHLPFDYLKIDGDFVRNLPASPGDQLIVQALVQVAQGMGKKTIAEFVANRATVALLRAYGVDYAQGVQLGRPGPLPDLGPPARTSAPREGAEAAERVAGLGRNGRSPFEALRGHELPSQQKVGTRDAPSSLDGAGGLPR